LFYFVKQKDSNKSIQTKEAQSWFDQKDPTVFFSMGDPTIISLHPFFAFLSDIMIFGTFSSLKKKGQGKDSRLVSLWKT